MIYTKSLCLIFLLTRREYLSGEAHRCLDSYFKHQSSIDKKIDVIVSINNGKKIDYIDLLKYQFCENVNKVSIQCNNLEGLDDLYARTPKELQELNLTKIPELGGSAGPNHLFFNTMIPLMDLEYKDYLMIESDTQPITDYWIDDLINYCDSNKFMIAGSVYKGKQALPPYEPWTGHLNGVAIYRRSNFLKCFLHLSKETIIYRIANNKNHFISFDVGMHNFLGTLIGKKYFAHPDFPEYHLVNSQIISNFSLPIDSDTTIESVKKQYPETIILHKKWN